MMMSSRDIPKHHFGLQIQNNYLLAPDICNAWKKADEELWTIESMKHQKLMEDKEFKKICKMTGKSAIKLQLTTPTTTTTTTSGNPN